MKGKLLIITGPQGSGNHIFSRVFSVNPAVRGWEDLLDNYWVPSDEEPFAKYWINPESLPKSNFLGGDYHVANVSVPFFYDGKRYVPKILEVAERAKSFGIDVEIAIVVRDRNINELQQQRVRKTVTMPIAQGYYYTELLDGGFPVHFLDTEALFLHRDHYLKWISKTLDFPIAYDDPEIFKYLTEDPNKKYVKYVEDYWLDKEVHAGCQPNREERLNG